MKHVASVLSLFSVACAQQSWEGTEQTTLMQKLQRIGMETSALSQAAAKAAYPSSYQQALEMEAKFRKLAAEAVRTGEIPALDATVENEALTALTALEGELEEGTSTSVDTFKVVNDAVAMCNTNLGSAVTNITDNQGYSQNESKTIHAACRAQEDEERTREKEACELMHNHSGSSRAEDPPRSCLDETFATVDAWRQCLEDELAWVSKAATKLGELTASCAATRETADATADLCDGDQRAFEMAFCQYDTALTDACSEKSACYDEAIANRAKVQTVLQRKVNSSRIMWESLKKVRCYLSILNGTDVTQERHNSCKDLSVNTTHLDVQFPSADGAEDCVLLTAKPGDEAWAAGGLSDYANLPETTSWPEGTGYTGLESVTSCTTVPTTAVPTAAVPTTTVPTAAMPTTTVSTTVLTTTTPPAPRVVSQALCLYQYPYTRQFGNFVLDQDMNVSEIFFNYTSGGMTCGRRRQRFGCEDGSLGLVITKEDQEEVLMPLANQSIRGFQEQQDQTAGQSTLNQHWYTIQGVDYPGGTQMLWNFTDAAPLLHAGTYRVWFNKDLYTNGRASGTGTTCYHIGIVEATA